MNILNKSFAICLVLMLLVTSLTACSDTTNKTTIKTYDIPYQTYTDGLFKWTIDYPAFWYLSDNSENQSHDNGIRLLGSEYSVTIWTSEGTYSVEDEIKDFLMWDEIHDMFDISILMQGENHFTCTEMYEGNIHDIHYEEHHFFQQPDSRYYTNILFRCGLLAYENSNYELPFRFQTVLDSFTFIG